MDPGATVANNTIGQVAEAVNTTNPSTNLSVPTVDIGEPEMSLEDTVDTLAAIAQDAAGKAVGLMAEAVDLGLDNGQTHSATAEAVEASQEASVAAALGDLAGTLAATVDALNGLEAVSESLLQ
jgi:hypothetical protein